ncbi:MAG: hypothetical protein HQ567_15705 [Candidatus Nealsonbacteria bacterium]|nr:hypothetical protein [Candidatus Nealsonbacteria bacterium]
MVVETKIESFYEWLLGSRGYDGALFEALAVIAIIAAVCVCFGWLIAALRQGPIGGSITTGRVLWLGVADMVRISPRRVWALAWLAVKESIQRRAIVVVVVFTLVLLIGGWFMTFGGDRPAQRYLAVVIGLTGYLVLALSLLISAMSLPADIKNKTLHTVVTKPVRASEIVLGRICGFTMVGTALLAVMGTVSYVFVVRGLDHGHRIDPANLEKIEKQLAVEITRPRGAAKPAGDVQLKTVRRTENNNEPAHQHQIRLDPFVRAADGTGLELKEKGLVKTDTEQGHWHELAYQISAGDTGKVKMDVSLSEPKGQLVARVPIYGKLRFKDRSGRDKPRGINVGDEWDYRSFIDGDSLAAAIWRFEGVTEENFPAEKEEFRRGVPVDMTIEVFRTYKGETDDAEKIPGVLGSLRVLNPKTDKTVEVQLFSARDFAIDEQYIPRKVKTPDGELDLFRDLAPGGKLEIWLQCVDNQQFFGAAQADLFIRADEASFKGNFAKGYLGIWMQMVLVIGIGVMFSTFVSGPIALLATLVTVFLGFFVQDISDLAAGEVPGGGPLEATVRLARQDNLVTPLEPGMRKNVTEMGDQVFELALGGTAAVLPDFKSYSFAKHVAEGFNVSPGTLAKNLARMLTHLLPLFVIGYFFLRTREVAQ